MSERKINMLDFHRILISPSILASDFARLGEEVREVEKAGCDLIHLDVMDGHFVPNLTVGPPLVKAIRKHSSLVFDTHLMITDPMKYIKSFVDAGADHITFHVETQTSDETIKIIQAIRDAGCTAGISLKPKTPADAVLPFLDKVDLVLVMTVEPGFGGQSFMADMIPKVKTIREYIEKNSLKVHLEVDGGIDASNVSLIAGAGANMIVAGTSVFRNPAGYAGAIAGLHAAQTDFDKACKA